jgi:hypothetical protein
MSIKNGRVSLGEMPRQTNREGLRGTAAGGGEIGRNRGRE